MKKMILLSCALAVAGCQANDSTLWNLRYAQEVCSANPDSSACMDINRLTAQAHQEAAAKTTALLLAPFVILEAVAIAKY